MGSGYEVSSQVVCHYCRLTLQHRMISGVDVSWFLWGASYCTAETSVVHDLGWYANLMSAVLKSDRELSKSGISYIVFH